MYNLKDLLNGNINEEKEKDTTDSGVKKVKLNKAIPVTEYRATTETVCPTDGLVEFSREDGYEHQGITLGSYLIWCQDTEQLWLAPNEQALNKNFIYRDDLEIYHVENLPYADYWIIYHIHDVDLGKVTRKRCYVLDNPATETYEVYYDSNYPTKRYGKATPRGMTVYACADRFQRDRLILELDKKYSEASKTAALEMMKSKLGEDEAIVVSDGAYINGAICYSVIYIDNSVITKVSEASTPSVPQHGVVLAEISGAYKALDMCRQNNKTKITYYYDNITILNVFKSKRLNEAKEVIQYKSLCKLLETQGYNVSFVEIHPKTGANRDTMNKALTFFHNMCDDECRVMSDIYVRDYSSYASLGDKSGKTLQQIKHTYNKKGENQNYGKKEKRV